MDRLTLTGRLTRDPELHTLPSGDPVCHLRLAVDGMAPQRETGYIDVAEFGPRGEASARVLSKGWLVAFDGRLEQRSWQTDDGQTRYAYQAIGNVEFLTAPRGDDGSDPEPQTASVGAAPDDEIPA